tara:strand:+ start:462 stop:782 length:321 start_codon:yes stop_codon:yes gene_type:complete
MIPVIRSLPELMATTECRATKLDCSKKPYTNNSTVDSGQIKSYISSSKEKEVDLPYLPKTIRRKWINNKEAISKFLDNLDYNNQIQSSYDLNLIAKQSKINDKNVA